MTVIVSFVPESNTGRRPFRKWPSLTVRHSSIDINTKLNIAKENSQQPNSRENENSK